MILQGVISDNQSAFVSERLATDNALIALKMFHSMKHKCKGKKSFIAMKLDE